LLIKIIWRFS